MEFCHNEQIASVEIKDEKVWSVRGTALRINGVACHSTREIEHYIGAPSGCDERQSVYIVGGVRLCAPLASGGLFSLESIPR